MRMSGSLTSIRMVVMACGILLSVLMPHLSQGAPALSDCRKIGSLCIEPAATRRVGAFDVQAGCWKWQDTYDCARPLPLKTDCASLAASPVCTKTGQTCVSMKEGVCARYRLNWHCTAKPIDAGDATLTSERYRIVSEKIIDSCGTQNERPDCKEVFNNTLQTKVDSAELIPELDKRCVSGAETRNLKGLEVERSCWQWGITFSCLTDDSWGHNCNPLERDANCTLVKTDCVSKDAFGNCASKDRVYSCGRDSAGTVSQTCGSQAWCVDGDCNDVARQPPNQSFGRAAAAMNLLQEMGRDFVPNGRDITIFSGAKMSCSKWIFGLKNCCKVGGLLLRADLAECSESEKKLAAKRAARVTWHVRSYCKEKNFFGICLVKGEDHCSFRSRLGRMLQEQARGQLGLGRGNCRGLTLAEIERVNWDHIDLSEVLVDIQARLQPMEAAQFKASMKTKIRAFYENVKVKGAAPLEEGE